MKIFKKLFDTKISTSYMFILFGVSILMLMGYFSYAWFTVQGVQQYSVVTGNLNGTVAIGSNSVTINGTGVITYTPSTDNDTITLTVTNTNDRTVKNSIYYYDLSDSSIEIGYISDSPTIPTVDGVSVETGKTLTYKIKIKEANGKQIKIGSSMGLNNFNLILPSNALTFNQINEEYTAEALITKANSEDLDYNTATDDQKNQMWTFSHGETEQTGTLTDYRYIGANPNNYVKFNDELWRIIGVFDVDDGTGKIEKRFKIIRNESLGAFSFDNKDTYSGAATDNGDNAWCTARLYYLLNDGYETNEWGGSLYWNSKEGQCYNKPNGVVAPCNFTETGLKDSYKSMIGTSLWYIGGNETYDDLTAATFYTAERSKSSNVFRSRCFQTIAKVGLVYSSDYGYATSGSSTTNRTSCLNTILYNWDTTDLDECRLNSWLFIDKNHQWTLTPYLVSGYSQSNVFAIGKKGRVRNDTAVTNNMVRPVVFLKSSVKITSGTGSSTDPFILAE